MSLKIDVPEVNYTAGSPVNGTVTLVADADINVQTISIKFVGCNSTFVQYCSELAGVPSSSAPDPYSIDTQFFAYETVIIQVPQTLRPPQSWPFEFVFPSKALPSSFADQGLSGLFESTCSITYKLKAHLSIPWDGIHRLLHSKSGSIKVTEKELSFTAARSMETSDPQKGVFSEKFTVESLHLLPGNENRRLTLGQHLRSKFHHRNLPKEAFTLSISMPRVAVIGKVLPIVLSVQHDTEVEQASGLAEPPKILLKHAEVVIRVNTDVASTGTMQGGWVKSKVLASSKDPKSPEIAKGIVDSLDIGEMLNPRIPFYFYPTFETKNITRSYTLDVLVAVECAQKTFKEDFRVEKLLLLTDPAVVGS